MCRFDQWPSENFWDFWAKNWNKWFSQASFKANFTPLRVLPRPKQMMHRQPLFPTQLDCAYFVSNTSMSNLLDCARAFYYTFRLTFVSLLHTPIAHISFAHIRASTCSLLHSAFSTQSDCAQCLYYTSRFNTTNPPHPFPAQLVCARKLGRCNSHKYLTRVR